MRLCQIGKLLIPAIFAGLLAACGGGSSGSGPVAIAPSPTPVTPQTKTVAITMNTPWTDTGMTATSGDQISFTASGNFNYETGSCDGKCVTTPAGLPWSVCATAPPPVYTAPGLPCYSLIGKIGSSGTPFFVGTSLQLTATSTGELYLGANDNYYPDDTGNWVAVITEK